MRGRGRLNHARKNPPDCNLRLARSAQNAVLSMLTFTRLVRTNLMHQRSIHDLTDPEALDRRYDPNKE